MVIKCVCCTCLRSCLSVVFPTFPMLRGEVSTVYQVDWVEGRALVERLPVNSVENRWSAPPLSTGRQGSLNKYL